MGAFGLENGVKSLSKFAVPVANQEANIRLAFRELPYHLSRLLRYSISIGISSDSGQMHLTCSRFDEEQNV